MDKVQSIQERAKLFQSLQSYLEETSPVAKKPRVEIPSGIPRKSMQVKHGHNQCESFAAFLDEGIFNSVSICKVALQPDILGAKLLTFLFEMELVSDPDASDNPSETNASTDFMYKCLASEIDWLPRRYEIVKFVQYFSMNSELFGNIDSRSMLDGFEFTSNRKGVAPEGTLEQCLVRARRALKIVEYRLQSKGFENFISNQSEESASACLDDLLYLIKFYVFLAFEKRFEDFSELSSTAISILLNSFDHVLCCLAESEQRIRRKSLLDEIIRIFDASMESEEGSSSSSSSPTVPMPFSGRIRLAIYFIRLCNDSPSLIRWLTCVVTRSETQTNLIDYTNNSVSDRLVKEISREFNSYNTKCMSLLITDSRCFETFLSAKTLSEYFQLLCFMCHFTSLFDLNANDSKVTPQVQRKVDGFASDLNQVDKLTRDYRRSMPMRHWHILSRVLECTNMLLMGYDGNGSGHRGVDLAARLLRTILDSIRPKL